MPPLRVQLAWLLMLAIPVACIAWTVTHEEIFREPRDYCKRQTSETGSLWRRKFSWVVVECCFLGSYRVCTSVSLPFCGQ